MSVVESALPVCANCVSRGVSSTCLCWLCHSWSQLYLSVLTGSVVESALPVCANCVSRGVSSTCLCWLCQSWSQLYLSVLTVSVVESVLPVCANCVSRGVSSTCLCWLCQSWSQLYLSVLTVSVVESALPVCANWVSRWVSSTCLCWLCQSWNQFYLSVLTVSVMEWCLCCSRSRSGSSWQSWPRPSVSSPWPRSVCTTPMTLGVSCCWPVPRAMPPWSTNWGRLLRSRARTMSHSYLTSSSESKCVHFMRLPKMVTSAQSMLYSLCLLCDARWQIDCTSVF